MVHVGFQRTLESIREDIASYLRKTDGGRGNGTIHCIGHSLGGAIASLVADWLKASPEFKTKVNVYTFGAPRVGLKDFAIKTSSRIDGIYRSVHGADPVPKIPVWPYYHAHINGKEYILDRTQGVDTSAHDKGRYMDNANHSSWDNMSTQQASNVQQRVVLNYQNRLQTTYSTHWADRIAAAIMTIMIDGGFSGFVTALQAGGAAIGTVYDAIAMTMAKIGQASSKLAEQIKGLLGHMLVFAGKGANITIELTEKFIRWVFKVTLGRLHKAAKQALNNQL
ncbi:hypothetical protein GCM10025776_09460 [Corallincola platygyrae]